MTEFVVGLLVVLITLLIGLMLTERFKFPLMMDFGMAMLIFGLVGAIDALVAGDFCTFPGMAFRWCLVGGGVLLMLLSIALRLRRHGSRRLSDVVLNGGGE